VTWPRLWAGPSLSLAAFEGFGSALKIPKPKPPKPGPSRGIGAGPGRANTKKNLGVLLQVPTNYKVILKLKDDLYIVSGPGNPRVKFPYPYPYPAKPVTLVGGTGTRLCG
jgi:hypothetical protein